MKFIKELMPYVIITLVVILIRTFIVSPVQVDGDSMHPTLKNNEYLILNKFDQSYDRFDIVVLHYNKERLVKRIIGLPGEKIEYKNSKLYINGKEIDEPFINVDTKDFNLSKLGFEKIPEDYYFLVGDNRNNSLDSRMLGLIKRKDIQGTIKIDISGFKIVK